MKILKFTKNFQFKNINQNKNFNFNKFPFFQFSKKELNLTDKMNLILKKEQEKVKGNEEDIKLIEEKTFPLIIKTQMIRLPAYITIPFLIWKSPISITYDALLLFSNYYLIFLTAFEGTFFFSLGINQHNLNNPTGTNPSNTSSKISSEEKEKEFENMRKSVIRRRLGLMIFFFGFCFFSAVLASDFKNQFSLVILFMTNLSLYAKFSFHITLYGLNKIVFNKRMKNLGMNLLLILFLAFINNRNINFVKNTSQINI